MREIKFRVWDKIIPKSIDEAELNKPSGDIVDWDIVRNSSYFIDALNGKYPLMQYTGLKDKNGTEIYEGDVITYPDATNVGEGDWWEFVNKGIVKYDEHSISYYFTKRDSVDMEDIDFDEIEVIGNIYENPELLEGEPDAN
uniref:YopX family protein n=1 Tax=uncultured Allobacillus sp. TaxID=1638025 RepID=UPI002595A941|nr:YopX family protein [uncultured Allobacillus sp.]